MQIPRETLDFYTDLLGRDEQRTAEICEPEILLSDDDDNIRIQSMKNNRGLRSVMPELNKKANRHVRGMAYQVLRKTLLDDRENGDEKNGTIRLNNFDMPALILPPKAITGSLTNLSIQPVSPDQLAEVLNLPAKPAAIGQNVNVPEMDSYFLLLGELKISRSIGLVAVGLRLSMYDGPTNRVAYSHVRNNSLHELDEKGRLVQNTDLGWSAERDDFYKFNLTTRNRKISSTSAASALGYSIQNAKQIEAGKLARPFGGMHE